MTQSSWCSYTAHWRMPVDHSVSMQCRIAHQLFCVHRRSRTTPAVSALQIDRTALSTAISVQQLFTLLRTIYWLQQHYATTHLKFSVPPIQHIQSRALPAINRQSCCHDNSRYVLVTCLRRKMRNLALSILDMHRSSFYNFNLNIQHTFKNHMLVSFLMYFICF